MIGNSLLTQVVIAGIAIGIVITYIQPTMEKISSRQDEIAQTKSELERVNAVNARLNQLVEQTNAISQRDKLALTTYLPDQIDTVQVLKDISSMTQIAGLVTTALTYTGEETVRPSSQEDDAVAPLVHGFDLTVDGPYENIKQLLLLLEQNNYPLEVMDLNITPTEGGLLTVAIKLNTYTYQ